MHHDHINICHSSQSQGLQHLGLLLPPLDRLAEVPLLVLLDHPMADAGDWVGAQGS